ncbi:MAG: YARHG domain-containing protein [Bacteroidota bacterium]
MFIKIKICIALILSVFNCLNKSWAQDFHHVKDLYLKGLTENAAVLGSADKNFYSINTDGIKQEYNKSPIEDNVTLYFENDSIQVYARQLQDNMQKFSLKLHGDEVLSFEVYSIYDYILYKGYIIFTVKYKDNYLEQIGLVNLNEKNSKFYIFPVNGRPKFVFDDMLYFESEFISERFSIYPNDIFKMPLNNWKKFELIYEAASEDGWFFSSSLNTLYTGQYLAYNEPSKIYIYNFDQNKYAITDKIDFSEVITIDDGFYFLEKEDLDNSFNYSLNEFPSFENIKFNILPDSLNMEYNRSRNQNLPLFQRSFNMDWHTDYIVYEAPKKELENLSKKKLKIVRNSLFAKYGYIFNSDDLRGFFAKYKWYNEVTGNANQNTIHIELSSLEMERLRLIESLENSKND